MAVLQWPIPVQLCLTLLMSWLVLNACFWVGGSEALNSSTPPELPENHTGQPLGPASTATVSTATDLVTAGPASGETFTTSPGTRAAVSMTTESMATRASGMDPTVSTTTSASELCPCDLSPGLCDLSCCCDLHDCDQTDLRSVFTSCVEEAGRSPSVQCVEGWMLFKVNVASGILWRTEGQTNLLCVQTDSGVSSWSSPSVSRFPELGSSWVSPAPWPFYRADDVILTYFPASSAVGVFGQPSPGALGSSCVDWNPAVFLRSVTLSCSRRVTAQSCETDPSLTASSYYSGIQLLRAPVPQDASSPNFTVPVLPVAEWPSPGLRGDVCSNVVSKVSYVVTYSGRGQLLGASVSVTLTSVATPLRLRQQHAVAYQPATPTPPPGPTPGAGLFPGSPVIGQRQGEVQPVLVLGVSEAGGCSAVPRTPVLFAHNYISGCLFSSSSLSCSELQTEVSQVLLGDLSPELVAVTGGAQPGREADWTRVIVQDCPPAAGCPLSVPVSLTTQVSFADATVFPQSPRGRARPEAKRPLDFFLSSAETAASVWAGPRGPVWPPLCVAVSLLSLLVYC
ncbi:tectonic-3-like isoform X2 [Lepisosteus oculatus]|uniref:tectonic-3-like isoform X2 n=1 Tax=Lepisosteus oculatus TaxID=7918 RepID=UPI00371A3810